MSGETKLPVNNCSNCKHFRDINPEIFKSEKDGLYAMECLNFVNPLTDCVMDLFGGHSNN